MSLQKYCLGMKEQLICPNGQNSQAHTYSIINDPDFLPENRGQVLLAELTETGDRCCSGGSERTTMVLQLMIASPKILFSLPKESHVAVCFSMYDVIVRYLSLNMFLQNPHECALIFLLKLCIPPGL